MKPYKIQEQDASPLNMVSDFKETYLYSGSDTLYNAYMHTATKAGVTKAFLDEVSASLGLTIYEIAPLLHISSRTLSRYEHSHVLDTLVSEHLLLLAHLVEEANEIFSIPQFQAWIRHEIRALDHKKPIDMLNTIFGIEMVRKLLGRIKHGLYS